MRLHHIALGAAEPEALAQFYREVFGLHEVRRWTADDGRLRSIWLTHGDVVLMIERTDAARPRVEGVGAGPFLLAFEVDPSERVAAIAALAARGVEVESQTAHTVYFRDPDGNRVALSSYPLVD